ncbi:MAG: glucuronate isomerase [Bacillota bacterium]
MKKFMNENFLLENGTAIRLYHEYAAKMPIIDYHCHLSPKEIAEDRKYRNITEIWLGGDHYKWRAMRINGVDEKYITGDADDREKFFKWAETMPYCIGNPLYHWTHLELKRYFGIDALLSRDTAGEIWDKCNELLQRDEFSAKNLIRRSNVEVICTTDDPADTLEYHDAIKDDKNFGVKVLPTFRPDNGINIDKPGFAAWVKKLSAVSGMEIKNYEDLKKAMTSCMEHFNSRGCKLSDHALDPVVFMECGGQEAAEIFENALAGKKLKPDEVKKYKTDIMVFLGRQYSRLGWTMQLHIGCIRDVNSSYYRMLGPNTGFDAIDDRSFAESLARLLDSINEAGGLPKTIIYCLNPGDNEVVGTITGCFQGGGIPGRIQFGPAWWFNDHKDGMQRQMTALASLGLLRRFVGMLTDSRSFLSYTRHEYFRRILCNMIGEWAEKGEAPNDMKLLGKMVEDICCNNAKTYFGF